MRMKRFFRTNVRHLTPGTREWDRTRQRKPQIHGHSFDNGFDKCRFTTTFHSSDFVCLLFIISSHCENYVEILTKNNNFKIQSLKSFIFSLLIFLVKMKFRTGTINELELIWKSSYSIRSLFFSFRLFVASFCLSFTWNSCLFAFHFWQHRNELIVHLPQINLIRRLLSRKTIHDQLTFPLYKTTIKQNRVQ